MKPDVTEVAPAALASRLPAPEPTGPREVELRPLAPPPTALSQAPRTHRRRRPPLGLFAVTFVLPVCVAAIYLFAIAAPRYASETSFIVRSSGGEAAGAMNVSSLMQSRGVSRAVDETYAINEYLTSPDVIAKLVAQDHLRDILNRPEADMFNRYPGAFGRDNEMALRARFETMMTQTVDEGTGISRLEVVAFRPEDARAIAGAMIKYAEEMVNRLNERAYADALRTANKFVDEAMANLRDTEAALNAYRDKSGSVDPTTDAAATMQVIQSLTTKLSQAEIALLQQEAMAPDSPQSAAMRQQIKATRQEIDNLNRVIVGTGSSVVQKLGKYEELTLRRGLAAKALDSAAASRDNAREDAEKQHLFVQVIREPSMPDIALYPRKFLDLAAVAAIALTVFLSARGLLNATMEHRA